MSQTARSARENIKGFVWLLVITFALWLVLISKILKALELCFCVGSSERDPSQLARVLERLSTT